MDDSDPACLHPPADISGGVIDQDIVEARMISLFESVLNRHKWDVRAKMPGNPAAFLLLRKAATGFAWHFRENAHFAQGLCRFKKEFPEFRYFEPRKEFRY